MHNAIALGSAATTECILEAGLLALRLEITPAFEHLRILHLSFY